MSRTWSGDSEALSSKFSYIEPLEGYKRKTEVPAPIATPGAERLTGTVDMWNSIRAFGFIKLDRGGRDAFVHLDDLRRAGIDRLVRGERLSFELRTDERGKELAINIMEAR